MAVGDSFLEDRIGQRVLVDAWHRDPSGDLSKARYLGSELDGGYAEYVKVPAANAHPIQSDVAAPLDQMREAQEAFVAKQHVGAMVIEI